MNMVRKICCDGADVSNYTPASSPRFGFQPAQRRHRILDLAAIILPSAMEERISSPLANRRTCTRAVEGDEQVWAVRL